MTANRWTTYNYREYAKDYAGGYAGDYNLDAIAEKLRDICAGAKPSEEMIDADAFVDLFKEHDTRSVEVYVDSLGRLSIYVCVEDRIEAALLYGLGRCELERAAQDYVKLCLGEDPWYEIWDESSYLTGEVASSKYWEDNKQSEQIADLAMHHSGYRYGVDVDSHSNAVRKFAEAVEDFADFADL